MGFFVFAADHVKSFVRLFFPRLCAACSTDLYSGEEYLCLHCRQRLQPTGHFDSPENALYGMLRPLVPVERAASAFFYGNGLIIQSLLHEVKYKRNRQLAAHLGELLGEMIRDSEDWQDIDLVMPVPLHERKRALRGFNQSELAGKGISDMIGVPLDSTSLFRSRKTATQTTLSRTARWDNVSGAFSVRKNAALNGKHILLIDDVITTGSTVLACAQTLLQQYTIRLSIAAVAFSSDL
jgi:ComF family protein